ncbi:hypothetical protein B0H67DRAFT_82848 [Lasiosphaeris hirsuta]|uniref:Uncharacterized protein n=1 Tax=Lasiosphaeris hirsuta TaxID=260670 RepID=A0AA40EDU4_9PEZI|nr:hypothetical protein B0H67DRAFT_82848 [Lasiosphaeris hirsuta]
MQIKPSPIPALPSKPQLHSHKHHHTYNGVCHMPIATCVRRSSSTNQAADECGPRRRQDRLFEVTLYYERNRACIIYRSWDDFATLEKNLTPWPSSQRCRTAAGSRMDVYNLHRFLREALAKRPHECAMEYFLRRRMGDCGGGS